MKTNEKIIIIKGVEYRVYSDMNKRGTFAVDPNGVEKQLRSSGYLSNAATIKRTIKLMFNL